MIPIPLPDALRRFVKLPEGARNPKASPEPDEKDKDDENNGGKKSRADASQSSST